MKIILAKTAGFCFGVSRAVEMVNKLLIEGEVVTLGPIIHNRTLVGELEKRGARVCEDIDSLSPGQTVVIRSHGVGADVYHRLRQRGVRIEDATCPYVKKIGDIIREHSEKGYTVVIAGDEEHPEVVGLVGHGTGRVFVTKSPENLHNLPIERDEKLLFVSQTTFIPDILKKFREIIKKDYTNAKFFDTICNATYKRQNEARELSAHCDVMVVIGDNESSNTLKLADICREKTKTFLWGGAKDVDTSLLKDANIIGVTAGASTPGSNIKEVLEAMSEQFEKDNLTVETEKAEQHTEDFSFEKALDESFKSAYNGQRVTGIVTGISPTEVMVDIGTKHAGYVPISDFTGDTGADINTLVKKGDELELLVVRVNDVEGTVGLSKRRIDSIVGFDRMEAAVESGEIFEGVVGEIVKGGVLVNCTGLRVFIPASQASLGRMEDLTPLLKTKVRFKILEVNRERRRAVGSVRQAAREERHAAEETFFATAEVGKEYTGPVKSITSYGVFVDIGGVDGMIHVSELSWNRIKHPSDVVKVGDMLNVYIKDIDPEKKKVSLGYRKLADNPWEIFKATYHVGDVIKAKIVSLTAFGAFAQIIPGIDGLIHVSQIAAEHVAKPSDKLKIGDEVTAKITEADLEKQRISLSIRALLEPEEDSYAGEADSVVYSDEQGV